MKKLVIILLPLLMAYVAVSQIETRVAKTIRGQVINLATNEPVAYTNIGIEDTFHGTASDENGNFQLKVPEEMVSKQIHFSSVGYTSLKLPVRSLFDKEFNIIKLESQTYGIGDIDISARSKFLTRILQLASENIPYNYISGPVNFVCQLSREKITNDTIRESDSAEVLIYDQTGYRNPSKTDEFSMRKYIMRNTKPGYSFTSGITNFDELLAHDWARSASSLLNPALSEKFELKIVAEPEVDGNPAWVISFRQARPTLSGSLDFHATSFEGKITIMKDDYSINKIEGSVKSDKHSRQGKFLAVGPDISDYYQDVTYTFEIIYNNLKPDVITLNKKYRYTGNHVEENTQLVFSGVNVENVKQIFSRDYFND
jgi:hypothetical protein